MSRYKAWTPDADYTTFEKVVLFVAEVWDSVPSTVCVWISFIAASEEMWPKATFWMVTGLLSFLCIHQKGK